MADAEEGQCELRQMTSEMSTINQKIGSLAVDDKVQMAKIFAGYGLPKKIISDADTNLTSETLRTVLWADEHYAVHNIIISPPEQ